MFNRIGRSPRRTKQCDLCTNVYFVYYKFERVTEFWFAFLANNDEWQK